MKYDNDMIKFIKIDFDSDMAKLMSDRVNLLSWALGGIGYLGFDLQGSNKAIVVICGWVILQYFSFVLFKVSKVLQKEEQYHGKITSKEKDNGDVKANCS
ncbi:MAG: hypothetical protein QG673_1030 [Pseudomonadota bacterium]|nr:hypothetical protein [Pseudomonadota bacterium]